MSVVWSSPRSSQPWSSHPAARLASAIRRALVADRAVWFPNRRRLVKLSPLADALAQLERMHQSFGRGAASAPPVGCAPARAPRPMPFAAVQATHSIGEGAPNNGARGSS